MNITTLTVNTPTREVEVETPGCDAMTSQDYLERHYPGWTSAVAVLTNRHAHDWRPTNNPLRDVRGGAGMRAVTVLLALALAGCASQEQLLQRAAEQSAVDDAKCAGMGTHEAYASCRLALLNARAADEALTKAAIAGVVATGISATGRR